MWVYFKNCSLFQLSLQGVTRSLDFICVSLSVCMQEGACIACLQYTALWLTKHNKLGVVAVCPGARLETQLWDLLSPVVAKLRPKPHRPYRKPDSFIFMLLFYSSDRFSGRILVARTSGEKYKSRTLVVRSFNWLRGWTFLFIAFPMKRDDGGL